MLLLAALCVGAFAFTITLWVTGFGTVSEARHRPAGAPQGRGNRFIAPGPEAKVPAFAVGHPSASAESTWFPSTWQRSGRKTSNEPG